ncbi:hypothetical protein K490DRAFT_43612 [Saccharata proteae CBS 121410]|uniref:Mediator complex subunit 27 n=1 Tax=Saccharata proteae CBS 121410 TaxID=1314787 RepID=A0A9P4LXZ2_9PEZI|nr:hypothetical protein K490DRAFT_43612 [Saccharata proteae CBS 121410]
MAETAPAEPASWDESQCQNALASLERLQDQLDELRMTIPSLITPLRTYHESPESLHRDFKHTVIAAHRRLNNFGKTWKSEATQEILARARESRQTDPDLSPGANVPRYGWVDTVAEEKKPSDGAGTQGMEGFKAVAAKHESLDVKSIIDAYTKAHPKFKVDLGEPSRKITILFKVPSLILKFVIGYIQDAEGTSVSSVECPGTMGLFPAITRCLATRPNPRSLEYLLEMIAAYTDTRKAPCAKCGKLLDRNALTPAARRSEITKDADGDDTTTWRPIHEACL